MTRFILDELRPLILHKIGIRNLSPSDCQSIALEITRKTKKNISETTIKRVFGFAAANHQFSRFTLNTLVAFTEDEEATAMIDLVELDSGENEDTPSYLSIKSKLISGQTVKKLIDDCSIPFEQTISRKFAEYDFEYFYNSKYSFTSFISQSGYGKSILLTHLVQKLFLNKDARHGGDIVLFLRADRIFNREDDIQDIEQAIFDILGIRTNQTFVNYFSHLHQVSGKKIVIILDTFYAICQQTGVKTKIFNSIVQFLVNIEDSEAIKLVLSMRTYTWRRFFDSIRHSIFLKNKWFTGSYYRPVEQSNVPVLTHAEIDQLVAKNKSPKKSISETIKNELKFPYNYSFYYQLKEDYQGCDFKSNLIFYEITLKYLNNKLYYSAHAVEKIILCSQLIQLSNYGKNGEIVDKNLLMTEFTKFRNAYMELLVDGILSEEKHQKNGFNTEYVRFTHRNVFEYFLFKVLLEQHQHRVNHMLLKAITSSYTNPKTYKSLLNWSVFQMIKDQQFANVKDIFILDLPPKDFTDLLLFFTENIINKLKVNPELISQLKAHPFDKEFLSKLMQLDFLDPAFVTILGLLSEISTDESSHRLYQSILNVHDCLALNLTAMQKRISNLTTLKHQFKDILINPSELESYLVLNFTGEDVTNHPLNNNFNLLTNYTVKTNYKADSNQDIDQKMAFFSIAIINWALGNSLTSLYKIAAVRHLNPMARAVKNTKDNYQLSILRLENLKNLHTKKNIQLENIIAYHLNQIPSTTLFDDSITHLIRVQQALNSRNFNLALTYADSAIAHFKESSYKILEVIVYQMVIKIYTALDDIEKINEYRYTILNTLEHNRIGHKNTYLQVLAS